MNTIQILAGVAGILAVVGMIKPAWPLACIGVLLLAICFFIK